MHAVLSSTVILVLFPCATMFTRYMIEAATTGIIDHIKIAPWKINFLQNNKRSRRNPIWLLDIYEIYFSPPPPDSGRTPFVVYFYDSMPEGGCHFIYAGLIFSLLSITLHHPNHISHYCLLSIIAASPIHSTSAPDTTYMSKCVL